jgi:hypothetical protein
MTEPTLDDASRRHIFTKGLPNTDDALRTTSCSASSNHEPDRRLSPLLTLHAELRNQICHLLLLSHTKVRYVLEFLLYSRQIFVKLHSAMVVYMKQMFFTTEQASKEHCRAAFNGLKA